MRPKNLFLLTMFVAVLTSFGVTVVQAGSKVQICHIPPGNPANYHTITISEKALNAHLGHGDLAGGCFENCETLCDDGDACTIDECEPGTEVCAVEHPPVSCDDFLLCTVDSCHPEDGCQYADIVCDDEDLCTVDTCNPFDGECAGTPIDCGPLGVCLPETGLCDFPCDGFTCDPINQCHEAGECVLSGGLPVCLDGAAVPDGTECDDGDAGTDGDVCTDGLCAGTPTSFCLNGRDFDGVLVTESPTDHWYDFTWSNFSLGLGEVTDYDLVDWIGTGIRTNTYPEVHRAAGVPAGEYRVWIYQMDESHDRSLQTTIGGGAPVRTTYVGGPWQWLDVGIHHVAPHTLVSVEAVGDFTYHGPPYPQRRGGFRSFYLTSDLTGGPPGFEPDGQSCPGGVVALP